MYVHKVFSISGFADLVCCVLFYLSIPVLSLRAFLPHTRAHLVNSLNNVNGLKWTNGERRQNEKQKSQWWPRETVAESAREVEDAYNTPPWNGQTLRYTQFRGRGTRVMNYTRPVQYISVKPPSQPLDENVKLFD